MNKIKTIARHYLDWMFIQTATLRVSGFNYKAEGRKLLNELKVCLVKQETFADLYTKPAYRGKELLLSTIHRSGPIGLFDAKLFDFFIVQLSDTEESTVWKFLKEDMNGPSAEDIISFKDKPITNASGQTVTDVSQHEVAVPINQVNWSEYDVVISINFSVDEKIVRMNPKVLWCYILQEPSMRYYRRSMSEPLFSYDLFLNQKFTYQVSKQKKHEINFPYNLMNSESFSDLSKEDLSERQGVFIEIHTVKNISSTQMDELLQFGAVRFPKEELFGEVLLKMQQSKYFFSFRGKHLSFKIWGNSMIDAVGAGLLSFGDPKEYHNLGLFTPFTTITSVEELIHKLQFLEKNPQVYKRELLLQQKLMDKYCFYNPVKQVTNAYFKKQMV